MSKVKVTRLTNALCCRGGAYPQVDDCEAAACRRLHGLAEIPREQFLRRASSREDVARVGEDVARTLHEETAPVEFQLYRALCATVKFDPGAC